jgi:hypothetical protein
MDQEVRRFRNNAFDVIFTICLRIVDTNIFQPYLFYYCFDLAVLNS